MYLGIDLHKQDAQVAVLDAAGELVDEHRVSLDGLEALAQQYAGGEAVLEATTNYYHIHDTLAEYLDVTVAHPGKLTLIAQNDTKTDTVDARELARLLRLGSVPESYVPTDEIREVRTLVRGRQSLLESRTEYVNKIHGLLADAGITRDVTPLSAAGRAFLEDLSLGLAQQPLLEAYLDVVDSLTAQLETLEALIEERVAALEETQLLQSAPGVGTLVSAALHAELGEIERFDDAKAVVSYVGLNPTVRESGDTRREGGISKRGPGHVRWLLVQAAHVAVHTCEDEYLSRFYDRLEARKNSKVAIVATARKLLVSLYHMLDRGEEYDPPGVSG